MSNQNKNSDSGFDELPEMTDDVFKEFQKNFREASLVERKELSRELIRFLYRNIHYYSHRFGHPGQTSDIAMSFVGVQMEKMDPFIKGFLNASTRNQFLRYLSQGVLWFINGKLSKGNEIQMPVDPDTNQPMEIPDARNPFICNNDPFIQEAASQMLDILNKDISDDEKDLIEMRLRDIFVLQNGNLAFCTPGQGGKSMTFAEIAAFQNKTQRAKSKPKAQSPGEKMVLLNGNSVRMRFNRIIEKLEKRDSVVLIKLILMKRLEDSIQDETGEWIAR